MPFSSPEYPITGPDGRPVSIPATDDPCDDRDPNRQDRSGLFRQFQLEGYVVVRGLVPIGLCLETTRAFVEQVKPSRAFFYRHESGKPERHVFTETGFMKYPLMNFQDLPPKHFGRFRAAGLGILTHPHVQEVVEALMGAPGKLVHTMFFEGNQVTWAHQDTDYLDSTELGRMIGAWVALEDIQPGAGRFYVYPGSHRLAIALEENGQRLDPNQHAYKDRVVALIRERAWIPHAPALRRGDALFFSSRIIHGSLETRHPECSRTCVTGHYVPRGHGVLWFQTNEAHLDSRDVNGCPVLHHGDRSRLSNELAFQLEARMPRTFEAYQRLKWGAFAWIRRLRSPSG